MNCPHCGAPMEDDAKICEICQESVDAPQKSLEDTLGEEMSKKEEIIKKERKEETQKAPKSISYMWIGVGAVLLIAVAAVVFFLMRGKTPQPDTANPPSVAMENEQTVVIATVNGQPVYKDAYREQLTQMAAMYAQFGLDMSDPDQLSILRDQIMESLIQQEVIIQQVGKQGVSLTEEEQSQALGQLNTDLESYKANFRTRAEQEHEADPSIDVDARTEELLASALEAQGLTMEKLRNERLQVMAMEKLQSQVYAEVTVTDAEAKAWYDENLPVQQEANTSTPVQYERDLNAGKPALFMPEGYARVKHILIKPATVYPSQELSAKETERAGWADEYKALLLAGPGNEAERAELEKKINESIIQSETIVSDWYNSIKAKADEVLAKVKAGEDFDALVAQYGEDDGMKVEPNKSQGYLFSKDSSFVEPFKQAALSLSNVGDTTDLVATEYGYHIIKLTERLQSAAVPFEQVKEVITSTLADQKGSELWTQRIDEWTKASAVQTYVERVADVKP